MIRHATDNDSDVIIRIRSEAIRRLASSTYSTRQIDSWLSTNGPIVVKPIGSRNIVLVEEYDGTVIAFAQIDADTSTVERLYVAPGFARRGTGARLLAQVEKIALDLGLVHLRLDATLNALPFYERAGYRIEQRCEDRLAGNLIFPYVKMKKQLGPQLSSAV